jgi:hypothetical protein
MAEAATGHALKISEAAVVAEQEQQALAKELAVTLSAHSSEMERARKVYYHTSQYHLIAFIPLTCCGRCIYQKLIH